MATITFDEIAERLNRRPTPLRPAITLTALGHASLAVYRLRRQLEALEPVERAIVLAELADAIRPLIGDLAAGL